jgi:hypothetical protein
VAREDAPGLTQHRGIKLIKGADIDTRETLDDIDLNECLYFNTRAQTATFDLQKEADVEEIIHAAKERGLDFIFFDVFRRLWTGDENDNEEVAKVLAVLTRIQTEAGCSVALVHHVNKSESGTIFQRIRGASAIYGWREWAFGLTIDNPEAEPEDRIRKIEFETKMDTPSKPLYYRIIGSVEGTTLEHCSAPAPLYAKKTAKKASEVAANGNGNHKPLDPQGEMRW